MESFNQILCEKRSYSREFHSHQHEYGQFLFPLQGSLEIITPWQEIELDLDYCFYLPPRFEHTFRALDRNEFLILDIPLQFLPDDTSSMYTPMDKKWASIRYLLMEESKNKEGTSALIDLTRYITNQFQITNSPSIDYIHKHFRESIKLETLAKIEHYHPVYYSVWFKRKTGKSPKDYIAGIRLQEAKNLLNSTVWSMTRISEELGFVNSSSFTRWFVKFEGLSPQKFRLLNKG